MEEAYRELQTLLGHTGCSLYVEGEQVVVERPVKSAHGAGFVDDEELHYFDDMELAVSFLRRLPAYP